VTSHTVGTRSRVQRGRGVETKEEVGFPHSRNYVLIVVLLRQLEVDHYTGRSLGRFTLNI